MIRQAIQLLVDKRDLTFEQAYETISEIMAGRASAVQTAAFLAALSTKSTRAETIEEITGCARAMRDVATPMIYPEPLLEIVGTGGDRANTFNISTTAAFVIAAGGVKVAKHGNRAASSLSGTADVQEALGVQIEQPPAQCVRMLDEVGMCFLFAQLYHKAMRYVGPIRKELGIRTVFNILGPLTNPANPAYMVMGVYDGALVKPLAQVLTNLGVHRGMVVFGEETLDELSTCCPTKVCEFADGQTRSYVVTPEELGLPRCTKDDLRGGTAAENAEVTRGILAGTIRGPRRDTALLNAGAGLYVAGAAASLAEGLARAGELVDSGAALAKLEAYVRASNEPLVEDDALAAEGEAACEGEER